MSVKITTQLVKELRDITGVSVMQCKKALEEAEGNKEKALAILKKTSSDIALKKSDRLTKDGAIMIQKDDTKAILVTLHCETDFVSRNEDFVNLLKKLTQEVFTEGIEKTKQNAKELIDPIIQKTGENIQLGGIHSVTGEILGTYLHNNKIGVIVSLAGGDSNLAKEVAMHLAAMKPEYLTPEEIDPITIKTMEEIFQKEIDKIEKPHAIKEKMLAGKIDTYFKEKTLLNQPFIKDPSKTVGELLQTNGAKILEVQRSII